MLLPLYPEFWDYICVLPCLDLSISSLGMKLLELDVSKADLDTQKFACLCFLGLKVCITMSGSKIFMATTPQNLNQ